MHRILIIEDDFSLNNTLAYNLRTAGYTVDSAYNAKEAFKYLKQYHYILLILDINLPDGNEADAIQPTDSSREAAPDLPHTARTDSMRI